MASTIADYACNKQQISKYGWVIQLKNIFFNIYAKTNIQYFFFVFGVFIQKESTNIFLHQLLERIKRAFLESKSVVSEFTHVWSRTPALASA